MIVIYELDDPFVALDHYNHCVSQIQAVDLVWFFFEYHLVELCFTVKLQEIQSFLMNGIPICA